MRKALTIVVGIIVFLILFFIIYIVITGSVVVSARTVKVVRELRIEGSSLVIRPQPLVNESDRPKRFSKQPVIPFLGIGFIEEEIDIDEVQTFETSFAFYTLDEKTGKSKDSEYVEAYVIEGKIKKVLDWDKFVTLLDVNEANYESKRNPFERKYTKRKDLLAEEIKILVASGNGTHQSPFITDIDEGSKVINLNERINHIEEELLSRRNCIINLQDKFGFIKEEEVRHFLIHEAPWYVVLGVSRFESLVNQAKELSGYLQSVYAQDLKPANLARRYVKDEDYIELLNNVWLAYTYEKNSQMIREALAEIEKEKRAALAGLDERTIRYAEAIAASFGEYLKKWKKTLRTRSPVELKENFALFVDEYVLMNILGALQYDQLKHQYDAFIEYGRTGKLPQVLSEEEKEKAAKVASDISLHIAKEGLRVWELNFNDIMVLLTEEVRNKPDYATYTDDLINYIYFLLQEKILLDMLSHYETFKHTTTSDSFLSLIYREMGTLVGNRYMDKNKLTELLNSYTTDMAGIFNHALRGMETGQQEELLNARKKMWEQRKADILMPYFTYMTEHTDMMESTMFWDAALHDVFYGEDISVYRPYTIHEVKGEEMLGMITSIYTHVSPKSIVMANMDGLGFSNADTQQKYEEAKTGTTAGQLYNLFMNDELKKGQQLIIPKVELYTDEWWDKQASLQDLRDIVIRRYLYRHISEWLPAGFNDYIAGTPEIQYLQEVYGIELGDIRLYIEKRSIYSNEQSKHVNEDYFHLLKRKVEGR